MVVITKVSSKGINTLDLEGLSNRMVPIMRDNGLMVFIMERVFIFREVEPSTMDNGYMIRDMARERNNERMVLLIMGITIEIKSKEMVL